MSNLAIKQIEVSRKKEEISNPAPAPVKILVVDDLPEKLLVYEAILEELGQELVVARSGEEALKLVLSNDFAVILLDVNMPGMDGFETAALIRKRRKSANTPIIFLTAFTDEMYMVQGYATGAVDYLPTPVVPNVLRAKVRVFIELFQMRQQAAAQAEERAKRAAAEESSRKSSFLANFSKVVAEAQNEHEILHALISLPIPYLADSAMFWLAADETGSNRMGWKNLEAKEIIKVEPGKFLADMPAIKKALDQVLASRRPQILSELPEAKPYLNKSDSSFPLITSAMVIPFAIRGQIKGAFILARAIAENPYTESDLSFAYDLASRAGVAMENILLIERIKEADKRKDEFLGMLAHELRNPLGPIRNAAQVLFLMNSKDERLNQLKDIIDRQVSHMSRLIDDLLDATRLARGQILLRKENCNLTQIVRQTVEDYRSIFDNSGLRLEVRLPPEPLWVEGDPTRLMQVVGNLLHNANKFTDKRGTVSISLKPEGKKALIAIRDNGIGIEPKMMPYIFDVFRQAEQGLDRNRGGLGLGLALVRGLVKLHGGDVSASSEGSGKGAEFDVRLPLSAKREEIISSDNQVSVKGENKYRILVIEDNPDAAESAKLLLSQEGHKVKTAPTGADGLKMARAFQPQIILCDIGLPGMDGYQVAKVIREDDKLSSAYVVALTGYGREEDQKKARAAGFNIHLTKPIDYNNLHRVIANLNI